MGVRKLSRWQKASALVPMAVLVGAWGAALSNTNLATAADNGADPGIPDVPAAAFDQPATVQAGTPAGIDARAGQSGTLSTLSTSGIPAASLLAYRRAETLLAKADSSCQLPWTLLAAIGRVESNHGRSGGNTVGTNGVSSPGIYGIPLTGANGTTKVSDTDGGALDRDAVYDRAVGPMQFLPGTWKSAAVDADGDNAKNPQDIDDAAATAGVYLCSGSGDLSTTAGASAAVLRYNRSSSYVDLVLKIADAYARGDYTEAPNGSSAAVVLTSKSFDQTLTPKQREKARKDEVKAAKKSDSTTTTTPGNSNPDGTSTDPGTPTTDTTPPATSPGDGSTTPPKTGDKTVSGAIGDTLNETPLKPLTEPVTTLLSESEARLRCILNPGLLSPNFNTCVYDLTH